MNNRIENVLNKKKRKQKKIIHNCDCDVWKQSKEKLNQIDKLLLLCYLMETHINVLLKRSSSRSSHSVWIRLYQTCNVARILLYVLLYDVKLDYICRKRRYMKRRYI